MWSLKGITKWLEYKKINPLVIKNNKQSLDREITNQDELEGLLNRFYSSDEKFVFDVYFKMLGSVTNFAETSMM